MLAGSGYRSVYYALCSSTITCREGARHSHTVQSPGTPLSRANPLQLQPCSTQALPTLLQLVLGSFVKPRHVVLESRLCGMQPVSLRHHRAGEQMNDSPSRLARTQRGLLQRTFRCSCCNSVRSSRTRCCSACSSACRRDASCDIPPTDAPPTLRRVARARGAAASECGSTCFIRRFCTCAASDALAGYSRAQLYLRRPRAAGAFESGSSTLQDKTSIPTSTGTRVHTAGTQAHSPTSSIERSQSLAASASSRPSLEMVPSVNPSSREKPRDPVGPEK